MRKQFTIKRSVSISGTGLHTGVKSTLVFEPAPVNTGVRFIRTDIENSPEILADINHVIDISRGTTIGQNGVRIHTIEHVMAAVFGLEIDNIYIKLDNKEPPVIDGSSFPFAEILLEAGIVEQDANQDILVIDRTITYSDPENEVDIHILPSDRFRVTFMIDYKIPALGTQYTSMYSLKDEFVEEYAAARTFCFLSEVEELKESGLIRGGDVDNALVFIDREIANNEFKRLKKLFRIEDNVILGDNGILNGKQLRFYNEPVRHKLLDLIGDFALLGVPIKGHIIAARSGHSHNVKLVRQVRKEYEKWLLKRKYQGKKTNQKEFFDINAINRILPHRYPFLLVDRIQDLIPGEKVSSIKNVTINESFFQGHFPGQPVMPGVLIIEAMAQSGGVLLLNTVEHPQNKLVYFTAIDRVRFRKPVKPGDVLLFEVEMLKFRLSTCKMSGKAYVDGDLVCEAELMAAIVEKES